MREPLDYGRTDRPRHRVLRLLFWAVGLWMAGFAALFLIAILLMTPVGRDLTTPSVSKLVARESAFTVPASFVSEHRKVLGGVDPAGFFSGRAAPADAAALIARLSASTAAKDITNEPLSTAEPAPSWWPVPTWKSRRSFSVDKNPIDTMILHIDPTTGEIAVEWYTT